MIPQTPWFERKFDFNFPVGLFPVIIERLRGTGILLETMLRNIDKKNSTHIEDKKWSIKEQVGHLYDLEELWYGRMEDFLAGKETLRAADLTNAKTNQANHNTKSIAELLK